MTVVRGDAQATFAATLVDEWIRGGVEHAVVAPGSRSTPLALALAGDGRVRVHVHLDERAAGFFALGIGLGSGRPAVVVTTSGTAAVELHPAIVEASQARVPLIACTADRPGELHHVHAPQTVEQTRLFDGVVRWSVEPGTADALPREHWRSIASRMVAEAGAGGGGPGPVHANLAFRDPLVGEPGELPRGRAGGAPWHHAGSAVSFDAVATPHLSETLGPRGVVVAGSGAPAATAAWAAARGWPVFADPRSAARGASNAVAAFDSILRADGIPVPDVVVRVGAPPASKVLSQWIAGLPDECVQVVVDAHGGWPDPERRATVRLPALPHVARAARDDSWERWWCDAERVAQRAIDDVLRERAEATEPGVIRDLTRDAPHNATFFVSSSMPIRDLEWFGHPASRHRVLSNRGANGIDGVVATALGVATVDPTAPTIAIVGDLAFLYDSSALVWAATRAVDLTIVVIDNGGGGIFSFLPQRESVRYDRFEQLFGTPHHVDISGLAGVHGIQTVSSPREGSGVRLVHVRTDRDSNVAVHAELNQAVATAIRSR
jgi:2-succinyl-5-enolpyruvyl-6-hydroxy-3-cyclohexene-1-carboxylate synthase